MSSTLVNVAIVDGVTITQSAVLRATKNGVPVKVKAIADGKYILAEGEKGVAPENITLKRVGEDLYVYLEGAELDQPQLIIEDFFLHPGMLLGLAEDGSYYQYVTFNAGTQEAAFLLDGDSSVYVLGLEPVTFTSSLVAASDVFWPGLIGIGVLGAVGGVLAANGDGGGGHSGEGRSDTGTATTVVTEAGITAPNVAVQELFDGVGPITGVIVNGAVTDDNTPTLDGTAETGSTVIVIDNGIEIGQAEVGKDGTWSFTPETPLEDGEHSISTVVVDEAGNRSPESAPIDFLIDTSSVEAIITHAVDDVGSVTGNLSSGSITDDTTPTLQGAAPPGVQVSIYNASGVLIGAVISAANGIWSFEVPALSEGSHSFTVTATDATSIESSPSAPFVLEIDTTAPNVADQELIDDVGPITGAIVDGTVTDDNTPTLDGTAEPGTTVIVSDKGVEIGQAEVGEDGTWSFTPETSLEDGEHSFSTVVVDEVGNRSPESDPIDFVIDTSPVTVVITHAVDDVGSVTGNLNSGSVTDDTTPTLQGTATANSQVKIHDAAGTQIGQVTAAADGSWSFEVPSLSEGSHSFTATATNAVGTQSAQTAPFVLEIDTTAPNVADQELIDDVGPITGAIVDGTVTDDNTPTLDGTAEPGTTVIVSDKGVEIGQAEVGEDGTWSFTPETPLEDGEHSFSTVVVDEVGNRSPESDPIDFVIDTSPVTVVITHAVDDVGSVTGNLNSGSVTDDTTPTLQGTATANSQVKIHDAAGTQIGQVTAAADGSWSFEVPSLSEGSHSFTATATNAVGTQSAQTAPFVLEIDTTAPNVADQELIDDVGPITGAIVDGTVTDDNTPTLDGTAEPGTTVIVSDKGVEIGQAEVGEDGTWSFTPETPLEDGEHSFSTVVVDEVGNRSPESDPIDFVIDTSPVTVVITHAVDDVGSVTGNLNSGSVTDDTTPTLQGTATANSQVKIHDAAGTQIGQVTAAADGSWSFEVPSLSEGSHSFTATATNAVGTQSAQTAPFVLEIDTTAPNVADQELIDDVGPITGAIVDGTVTDDNTPTLDGTAEPGTTVIVSDKGVEIGQAEVGEDGTWSFTPETPLEDGEHSFSTVVVDEVGNRSPESDPIDFVIDTSPVTVVITHAVDDVGSVTGNLNSGSVTDDTTPTLQGTATANSQVKIHDAAGTQIGQVTAAADGSWSFEVPSLSEGSHSFTATATNAVGTQSAQTAPFVLEIDTTAPNVADQELIDDVGPITGAIVDGTVTDDNTPTLDGTAEPGTTVIVSDKGVEIGQAEVGEDGTWSFTPETPLEDGEHSFSTVVVDEVGNRSPESDPIDFVIDTSPVTVVITHAVDDVGSVTGNLNSGSVTDDTTPTLQGTATANSQVKIHDAAGTQIGQVTAAADGSWSFEVPSLSEGSHSFTATATNAVGTQSAQTAPFVLEIDTTAPNVADQELIDDVGPITGAIVDGTVTDDNTPTLDGTAEPGTTVIVSDKGVEIGQAEVGEDGTWSFTPETPLEDGEHSFSTVVVDEVGNRSPESDPIDFVIDTSPVTVVITHAVDDVGSVTGNLNSGSVTDDTTPTLQGTATANSQVKIHDAAGTQIGQVTAAADGSWSFEVPSLSEGSHSFTATATNAVGTQSAQTAPFVLEIDTTAPNVADQELIDDVGPITGAIVDGTVTDDNTPTLDGTAEPGTTVIVSDKGVEIGQAEVGEDGTWSFTPETPLEDGEHSFSTVVVDEVGNRSPESDPIDFVIDTSPVTVVITHAVDDVGSVTGNLNSGSVTDDTTPTLQGTATANSQVKIHDAAGTQIGQVTAAADGSWSFEVPSLSEGSHSFTATATNAVGTQSAQTAPFVLEIDTTAPNVADQELIDDVGPITGAIVDGTVTDDNTPTLDGTAEPGTTVIVSDKGVEIGQAEVGEDGTWSFTPETPLEDGEHSFSTVVVDEVGNRSPESDPIDFVIDTSPVTVVITHAVDDVGSVTGNLNSGSVTDDTTPTLQGTATANSQVKIHDAAGTQIGQVTAAADGSWSFEVPSLSEGSHSFTATATNAVGTQSAQTAPFVLEIDTTAPNVADQELIDDVGPITGAIVDGTVTDDNTPTLDGTAEPGTTVIVSDKGVEIGQAEVGEDGTWSFTPETPLEDGEHSFSTVVVDEVGNRSPESDPIDFVIDTSPVTVVITHAVDDVGSVTGNLNSGSVTDDTTPTLQGTATANSQVKIHDAAGTQIGQVTAAADGSWSFEVPSLSEGSHSFTATATNAVGTQSAQTAPFVLEIDTTAPNVADQELIDDVGPITGAIVDGTVTDDNTPTLDGTAEPGTTVIVSDKGVEIGQAEVGEDGTWSFTPETPLEDGEHSFSTVVVDEVGNRSPESDPIDFVIDTSPVTVVITHAVDDVGSVTGNLNSGSVTDDTTPTLQGTATANSQVKIHDAAGTQIGQVTAAADGSWSFEVPSLSEGSHSFTATATNAVGTQSAQTAPFVLEIDTTAPNVADQELIDDVGPITGAIVDGTVTDDNTPTLDGTAEPGTTVIVSDKGVEIGQAEVGEDGTWSFTPETPLEDGEHSFSTVVVDEVGNRSPESDPIDFVIDTSPVTVVITHAVDDVGSVTGNLNSGSVTDDTTPTLQGTATANSQVKIHDAAGTQIGQVTAAADGSWSFEVPSLSEGSHSFTATATNAVGTQSAQTAPFVLEIDTTAPNVADQELIDDVGPITGAIVDGTVTDDNTPTLDGTAEPGTTVIVSDKGVEIGQAEVGEDGTWSFTPETPLEDGEHSFSTVVVDEVGNRSPESDPIDFVIDTSPVTVVITHAVDDVGSVTGNLNSGSVTDDTTPTLQGTATANSQVKIHDAAGTQIGQVTAAADGSWSFEVPSLSEGSHSFTATATNAVGTQSAQTAPFVLEIDTTAPNVADQELIDDVGPITGAIVDGTVTDDNTPTLDGTAEPGTTVIVSDKGVEIGQAEVGEDGTWSFTPETPLEDGEHSFSTVVVDEVGNRSPESDPIDFVIDTSPVTVVITHAVDDVGSVTGNLNSGSVTDDTTPTLQGTATANSQVKIHDAAGTQIGQVTAAADGSWSFEVPSLSEGSHSFTATATNAVGTQSAQTAPFVLEIDTTAPNVADQELIDDVGPITGAIVDGTVTDDNTPTLDGTAEPGTTVIVSDKGVEIGQAEVGEDGTWSFTPETPLEDGEHSFSTVVVDEVGNRSPESDPIDFVIDTSPVTVVITHAVDDVGSVTGNLNSGSVTDDTTPTLQGTATANSQVKIHDAAGTQIGQVTAAADGSWSFEVPSLSEGSHSFTATATNAVGTQSAQTAPFVLEIDTTAPNVADQELIDDVGPITGAIVDGTVTDDNTPTLDGTAEPGTTVIVSDKGVEIGQAEVGEDGTWSFTPETPLEDGEHSFSTVVVDEVGNRSPESDPIDFVIDTSPVTVVITHAVDDVGSVTGNLNSGSVTDDTTPTLQGTATANSQVKIHDAAGTQIGQVTAAADGSWSFEVPSLSEGSHSFTATATNAVGTQSAQTAPFVLEVDTTAPVLPTEGSIEDVLDDVGASQGTIDNGGVTDDSTPTLVGLGTPGDTVSIYDGGKLLGQAQVDGNGDWTFTPATELDDGLHEFIATFTDPAGNTSAASMPWVVTVDTSVSAQAVITAMSKDSGADSNDFVTNDGTAGRLVQGTLTATLKAGEKVQISTDGGGTWLDAIVNDDGTWNAVDQNSHSSGWLIQARVVGTTNETNATTQSVTLDTTVNAPTSVVLGEATIEVTFDGAGLVVGDKLHVIVDGVIVEYGLSKSEISAGAVTIPWSDSVSSIKAALADQVGNISFYREQTKADGVVFVEDFEGQEWQRLSAGQIVELDYAVMTVNNVVNGSFVTGFGNGRKQKDYGHVTKLPESYALELGKSGAVSFVLPVGENINHISFQLGDLTGSIGENGLGYRETVTIVFYDQNGAEVVREVKSWGAGTLIDITAEIPAGTSFSSFDITLSETGGSSGYSYTWVDNIIFSRVGNAVVGELTGPEANQIVSQNDVVYYGGDADNVFSLADVGLLSSNGSGVNGGAGTDTLTLTGADQVLDLTALDNKIVSIEVIDLTGSGDNTLNLSLENVLGNGQTNLFHDTDTVQMMVKGDAGDVVNLDGLVSSTDSGEWVAQGSLKLGVTNYQIYQHSTLAAELLVQQGMQTNLV
ncbi:Ig-like domain-containing protein [Pseudomonas chlororaphis]|uniref:Ig-like domain-containing protein n=1 Tax=Pseudomonas chlororaphis TaxID=587753 RepID=UPI001926A1C2|nr:Ig-like domain-containing protein [Pseudomonas chlororaphis]QQX57080.1 hypothetical protein JHW28_21160 [Pseudomonas chlororaphis subsp. aurantiaca]